ncbi:MAG: AraC family transcriptional regulator, partial [Polyangiaceae bacterium]
LLGRTVKPAQPRVRRAIHLIEHHVDVRVSIIADEVGVSERQLERLFDERVGIGPKSLARVVRMRRALSAFAEHRGNASWSRIAAHVGYADQAHLARDIVRFTSLTPSQLAHRMTMSDSFKHPLGPLAIVGA